MFLTHFMSLVFFISPENIKNSNVSGDIEKYQLVAAIFLIEKIAATSQKNVETTL